MKKDKECTGRSKQMNNVSWMQPQGSEVEGQSTSGADLQARVAERRLGTKFGRMGKAYLTGKEEARRKAEWLEQHRACVVKLLGSAEGKPFLCVGRAQVIENAV